TDDIGRIELQGKEHVFERAIEVVMIVQGGGVLPLGEVGIRGFADGIGEECVVVVEDGQAAFDLDGVEKKDGGEGRYQSRAHRRRTGPRIGKQSGASRKDGKTHGGDIEIAFGEEIQGNGIDAERRRQSEQKPAQGEWEDGPALPEKESSGNKKKPGYKSGESPKGKVGSKRKRIKIVHADGKQKLSDIAGEEGGNGEEKLQKRKP